MKIVYQGISGSYSESCAKENYPNCETISCKTFDECFDKASKDSSIKAIIPESNKTTGNIGVEYLIFKYRLNIYAEYFYQIQHNLLGISGSNLKKIKNVYSHAQALSQSSLFLKKNNLNIVKIDLPFNPDIIHIVDWVNINPGIIKYLATFKKPIIRHFCNFEDLCYFHHPFHNHKDNSLCTDEITPE